MKMFVKVIILSLFVGFAFAITSIWFSEYTCSSTYYTKLTDQNGKDVIVKGSCVRNPWE